MTGTTASAAPDLEQLQKLADYYCIRWEIQAAKRATGWLGFLMVFGTVLMGIPGGAVDWAYVVVGIFLLAESLWLSANPSADRLLLEGIVLGLIGLGKLTLAAQNAPNGLPCDLTDLIAVFVTLGAIRYLLWYRRARNLFQEGFTKDQFDHMHEWCEYILAARSDQAHDVIDFQAGSRSIWWAWKCLLEERCVWIIRAGTRQMRLVPRNQFILVAAGKIWGSKNFNVQFQVNGETWNGSISKVSLENLLAWQKEPPLAAGVAPS